MDAVIYSSKIQSVIKRRYPNVTKLINYNAEGTVALLQANNAVSLRRGNVSFRVHHSGDDNYKAWYDYKEAIITFLENINDDVRLGKARKQLARKIWSMHYEKYPFWPRVGGSQSATFNLATADIYDHSEYVVAWACEGEVTVTDERPRSDEYMAKFNGKPVLKILMINDKKVRQLEYDAQHNFNAARRKVDLTTRSLTWDSL